MLSAYVASLLVTLTILVCPCVILAQGETTSAITGQITDPTNAAIAGAMVTIANSDTGLQRARRTDDEGRFNFPQLKPGNYSVKAEAKGFERQQIENVFAGLGQKQSVNFTLKLARSSDTVEVSGAAPLINPENANASTNLNAPALENLPNPGGDLTYPLQFAPGALINTAGSGNDFVGGTNGYGNVQFNGLPAISNGYIVDGLETNDPLTNLNSGLSTNLVLGLNSISEVTVNTLSYAVDQGRYGASQVNYVTKSGTNAFHGNLYETWNASILDAADYFTNATPGNHKPRSTVNHFGVLPLKGSFVRCDFSAEPSDQQMALVEESDGGPKNYVSFQCEVQAFFEDDTAVISPDLADAGELTQGLCSPWQNDYRECSCYYWASARPDYVNVELGPNGLSTGDNWMQRERSNSYVADDYADTRLLMYDELFAKWEQVLKFQIGGRDVPDDMDGDQ